MVLSFLLLSTLAFAQDAEDGPATPTDQGAEAADEVSSEAPKETPKEAVEAPLNDDFDDDLDDWEDASDEDPSSWDNASDEPGDDLGLDDLDDRRGGRNKGGGAAGLNPMLVGAAAGFCPSSLCVCIGMGGCVGTTIYYYRNDPNTSGGGAYGGQYGEEARKRRAIQAFVGGTIGVVVGMGVNLAVGYAVGYI